MKAFRKILAGLFERRVRGFRVIELIGCLCLAALVLGVYAFKAGAGAEGAQINDAARQIAAEQRRVRALKAELAHLESPDRLERLATTYLGMAPVAPKKETDPDAVAALASSPATEPTAVASAVPAAPSPPTPALAPAVDAAAPPSGPLRAPAPRGRPTR
jgi:cell division protein FtsL